MNQIILEGFLGRDAEVKTTPSGTKFANFSLATTDKSKDGKDNTEWHRVKAFGYTADHCEALRKGMKVYVRGKMTYGSYENKQGQKVSTADVVAFTVSQLPGKTAGVAATHSAPAFEQEDQIPF